MRCTELAGVEALRQTPHERVGIGGRAGATARAERAARAALRPTRRTPSCGSWERATGCVRSATRRADHQPPPLGLGARRHPGAVAAARPSASGGTLMPRSITVSTHSSSSTGHSATIVRHVATDVGAATRPLVGLGQLQLTGWWTGNEGRSAAPPQPQRRLPTSATPRRGARRRRSGRRPDRAVGPGDRADPFPTARR